MKAFLTRNGVGILDVWGKSNKIATTWRCGKIEFCHILT